MNQGQIGAGSFGGFQRQVFIEHVVDSEEKATGNIAEDAVALAIENHHVAGVVQDDALEIVGVDFPDADAATTTRPRRRPRRPRTAPTDPHQIPLREVTDKVIQTISGQWFIQSIVRFVLRQSNHIIYSILFSN